MTLVICRSSTHLPISRCSFGAKRPICHKRAYAQVGSTTFVGGPPPLPPIPPDALDSLILASLPRSPVSLPILFAQSTDKSGFILDVPLPYESRPNAERRTSFESNDHVALIAHAVQRAGKLEVARCSGFALRVDGGESPNGGGRAQVLVTCMHTLQEVSFRMITDGQRL